MGKWSERVRWEQCWKGAAYWGGTTRREFYRGPSINTVCKGNDSVFSFLWPISEKMDKNTNIKSQNIKTFVKNCYTFNSIKVFNNFSFSASNEIIYSSKSLTKSLKPIKSKTHWQNLLVPFFNP